MINRRSFLGSASLAFLGLQRYSLAESTGRVIEPFGPLVEDPAKILDLPAGFTCRVIATRGETMSDGFKVPGAPDGMAAFAAPDGKLVLVCNHELGLEMTGMGPFLNNTRLPAELDEAFPHDPGDNRLNPSLGGTTNLIFDPVRGEKVAHFLSLTGTDRNCAGGAMPWGSWVTCEEPADLTQGRGQRHGWCFEVKATAEPGLQRAVPLKALGRFRHEAVALDPRTGILYLTEDRGDGLLYRFIPDRKEDLSAGKLQALAIVGRPSASLQNYDPDSTWPQSGAPMEASWIDLENTEAPADDLRIRGHQAGAARFARGEGIHFVDGSFYICCTDGGPSRRGQIFRLEPSLDSKKPDRLELFLQPEISDLLTNGDNLCAAPWGGVVVCEDLIDLSFAPAAHVRCVTPEGKIFTLARNPVGQSEFAGCCFSPDGKWFFVNMQSRGLTVAVTGPWEKA
ncbi:alkaline phosphatase PhoX [Luteolibacter marinus]|uniref:alkaline phosphatase PhoX n=1 Tax=Luteolibacter marinus TaxID=2776705 RepID=UPI0018672450|nr:alkaline phosphatase PhoX [Luteolibacter marinus]